MPSAAGALPLTPPSGAGKTMLARRFPGLLPPLTWDESLTVTKIHSLVAEEPPPGLYRNRPFRCPHPGISRAGLIGGTGTPPRPGEATLAHHGVLFLDDLPEFSRTTLAGLRQPLKEGAVRILRGRGSLRLPARFTLIAAMSPLLLWPPGGSPALLHLLTRSRTTLPGANLQAPCSTASTCTSR